MFSSLCVLRNAFDSILLTETDKPVDRWALLKGNYWADWKTWSGIGRPVPNTVREANNNCDDPNDMLTMNNSFFSTPHLAPLPEEVNLSYASDTTSQQSHDSYDSGFGESGAGGKEELCKQRLTEKIFFSREGVKLFSKINT